MGMLQWAGDLGRAAGEGIGNAASAVADTAQSVGNAVGDTLHDAGAGLFGWDSTQEQENQERADQARSEGEKERAALQRQNRGLEEGVSGYDPPSIDGQTNWESFSHREIFDRNQQIHPGKAEEAQRSWGDIGKQLGGLGGRFSGELRKKLADGWEGEAADAASQAGDPLAKWMSDSGGAFELTGNRVQEASSAAGQVKGMIPEPTEPSAAENFGRGMGAAVQPTRLVTDTVGQMNERQESERHAQQTMHRVLGTTYRDVDSQVPAYKDVHHKPVPPPDPPPQRNTQSLPPPVDPGQVDPASTSSTSSSPVGSVPSAPGVPGLPGTPGGPGDPAGSESAWTPGGGGSSRLGPGGVPGAPLRRQQGLGDHGGGMMPVAGTGGLSGAGAAAGARGGVGGGKIGGSAGAGTSAGARGAAPGAGGRAGAGAVGSGSAATGAGASGSSGAGARGGAMGGAGAGQRGGQGGEEEEHDRPSWLEENDEVWLNDMPRVAPSVFGE